MVRLFVVIAVAIVLSGCESPVAGLGATPTPTCQQQAFEYANQIQPIAREWDDANTLAGQTPRASLAAQIEKLQAIRRRAQDIKPPECASTAHLALTNAMDKTVEGYLAFLGQRPDSEVNQSFEQAKNFMAAYTEAIGRLAAPATPVP